MPADEIVEQPETAFGKPVTFPVRFLRGMLTRGNRPRNPYYFGGAGEVAFDATSFRMKGKNAEILWGGEFEEHAVALSSLRNASCEETKLRVDILKPGDPPALLEVVFWANDAKAAAEIFARMPKVQTEEYATRTREEAAFGARLKARTPHVFAAYVLMALAAVAMIGAGIGHGDVVGRWVSDYRLTAAEAHWARLVASVFMPSALLPGVVGMITLYAIGPKAERIYGHGHFLFLYLLSGLAGSFASAEWHGSMGHSTASGAYYGLIGAFLAYFLKGGNAVPVTVVRSNKLVAFFLLGWNLLMGISAHVDYVAGFASLVVGFTLGYALGRPLEAPGPQGPDSGAGRA